MSRCRPPVRTLLVLTPLVYWCINLDLLHATWIPWIPWIAVVLMVDSGNDSYTETQRNITGFDCVIVILIFMDIYVSYDILWFMNWLFLLFEFRFLANPTCFSLGAKSPLKICYCFLSSPELWLQLRLEASCAWPPIPCWQWALWSVTCWRLTLYGSHPPCQQMLGRSWFSFQEPAARTPGGWVRKQDGWWIDNVQSWIGFINQI